MSEALLCEAFVMGQLEREEAESVVRNVQGNLAHKKTPPP